MIKCKNCGDNIVAAFTKKAVKDGAKQYYLHYCYGNHSPTQCRQYPGHSDKECCKCSCIKPEEKNGK